MARKVGDIVDGYRYKGGDEFSQDSYEPIADGQFTEVPKTEAPKETQFDRQYRISSKRLSSYDKQIDSLSQEYGVDPSLIRAVASQESTGRQFNDDGRIKTSM